MNALVVYFSRSGHTRQVAKEIAQQCGADLEEIREPDAREGAWGYWRSGWQVLTRAEPPVLPMARDPAAYDTEEWWTHDRLLQFRHLDIGGGFDYFLNEKYRVSGSGYTGLWADQTNETDFAFTLAMTRFFGGE